jgi:hypothetical protein
MIHQIKSHPVSVAKITRIEPLLRNGNLTSPELGLTLRLDNGAMHQWLSEPGNPAPVTGDFFVTDELLGLSFIVSADRFNELFEAVAA